MHGRGTRRQDQGDPMSGATRELKGGVGLTGVVMLGAGTAIGVSIFSVMAPAAQIAGSALLVAVLISARPILTAS